MTQQEKIEMLKSTIEVLYEKEGRSKSYISRLLDVDRKTLSNTINYEWKFVQGNIRYMKPSNRKFLNKHRNMIKARLDRGVTITDIAKELKVKNLYLTQTIIPQDDVLKSALKQYHLRNKAKTKHRLEIEKSKSKHSYNVIDLEHEEWKEIMGYSDYYISNKGRVKKYVKTYDDYMLITPQLNPLNGRVYVYIDRKALQVSRLVGFSFVEGYSKESNTINHKDLNVQNNKADNLEWVSQSVNNQHSYDNGRVIVKSYQKYGKFKKIRLDDKYEFKTITALAKFLGKSQTQTRRYIDGECKTAHKFEFIY